MKILSSLSVLFLSASVLSSCHNAEKTDAPATADTITYSSEPIRRFDIEARNYGLQPSDSLADSIIGRYGAVVDFLAAVDARHGATARREALGDYAHSPVLDVFLPDVQKRLPDLSGAEDALGQVKARMSGLFGTDLFPKAVVGFETPYNQRVILLADTVALVGLNHYLGPDYPGYAGFADYQRVLNRPERMAIDVAEAVLSSRYPYESGGSSTVLSRIIYEGVMLHALQQLLPAMPLHEIMGYTPEQLAEAERTQQQAWQQLAREGTLYSIDPMQAERLVSPAPYTQQLGAGSVPRMGRFIGYNLVSKYMDNNGGVDLKSMLQPSFYGAETTVVKSQYAGN